MMAAPLQRLVVDWHAIPLGHVRGEVRAARGGVRGLVVDLTPDARERLGTGPSVVVPARFVAGVSRDVITLDRSLDALRGADALPAAPAPTGAP